jgi:tetratricopeptide (TPR) repeat protein
MIVMVQPSTKNHSKKRLTALWLLMLVPGFCPLPLYPHPPSEDRLNALTADSAWTAADPSFIILQASILADRGAHPEALQVLEKLDTRTIENPAITLQLGALYRTLQVPELARKQLLKTLTSDRKIQVATRIRAHLLLADLASSEQSYLTAANHLQQALKLNPQPPAHLYTMTVQAMQQAGLPSGPIRQVVATGLQAHPGHLPLLELNIAQARLNQSAADVEKAIQRLLTRYPLHPRWQSQDPPQ